MLGSDPLSALLGAGLDPRSPKARWKTYIRQLVAGGSAVTMLGPDVVDPPGSDDPTRRALITLADNFPPFTPMPVETTGKLAGAAPVETDSARVNARVDVYYRRLAAAVKGTRTQKDAEAFISDLIGRGALTPSIGLHIELSRLVLVEVPDAEGLAQWHAWAAQTSADHHEAFTAPTVLDPSTRGGGRYLFRADDEAMGREFIVGRCKVTSGDVVVPVPPSTRSGEVLTRLGPCRRLPDWLRAQLHIHGAPPPPA